MSLQWEKTKASQDMQLSQQQTLRGEQHNHGHHQLMYNNGHTYPLELSTLVWLKLSTNIRNQVIVIKLINVEQQRKKKVFSMSMAKYYVTWNTN